MTEHQDAAFVEYIVKELVENKEAVKINRTVDEMGVLIQLTVDRADMGRVIGKEGRTAKAIRTLLRVLGAKNNARVNLKIMEPDGGEVEFSDRDDTDRSNGNNDYASAAPVAEPMNDVEPLPETNDRATEVL